MNKPVKTESIESFEELLQKYNAAVHNLQSSFSSPNANVYSYDTKEGISAALRNSTMLRLDRRVQVEALTNLHMELSIKIERGAVDEYHAYLEELLAYNKANA